MYKQKYQQYRPILTYSKPFTDIIAKVIINNDTLPFNANTSIVISSSFIKNNGIRRNTSANKNIFFSKNVTFFSTSNLN